MLMAMAGPDTGQFFATLFAIEVQITYLMLLPSIIVNLITQLPSDPTPPMNRRMRRLHQRLARRLRPIRRGWLPKRKRKKLKPKPRLLDFEGATNGLRRTVCTHLARLITATTIRTLRFLRTDDCCVSRVKRSTHLNTRCCAFDATVGQRSDPTMVRFDTDSFRISVDSCASRCMACEAAYFEDLKPTKTKRKVNGISQGLEIAGTGTFIFDIQDDEGKVHTIRVPNSLYVPDLKVCLLSPQHWAQEASDNHPNPRGTRMENDEHGCTLFWGQAKYRKSIPFDDATNTPVFRTASSTHTYRAFVAAFNACEDTSCEEDCCTRVQPGKRRNEGASPEDPDEFIAEENIHLQRRDMPEAEGATADDATLVSTNLSLDDISDKRVRSGATTFDPSPP